MCVGAVTLVEQLAVINEDSIDATVEKLCALLPAELQPPCKTAVETFGWV